MSAANQPYTEAQKAMIEKFNAHIRKDSSSFAAPTGLDDEQVRAAIEAEPELPGDMPDEMWAVISKDRDAAAECLRIVVRQTKVGIIQRLGLKASNAEVSASARNKSKP